MQLRIFATLAALSFSGSALADQIVQTQSLADATTGYGPLLRVGPSGHFAFFDPALGVLDSVVFEYAGVVSATNWESNPWSFEAEWTPSIHVEKSFLLGSPILELKMGPSVGASGAPQIMLANLTGASTPGTPFTAEFTVGYSVTIDSSLQGFTEMTRPFLDIQDRTQVVVNNSWGTSSVSARGTEKLTYNYHAVPEAGCTLVLVGFTFGGLIAFRRKSPVNG